MIRTIAFVVFPGAQSLDITGPMDVFAEANLFLAADQKYSIEVIGLEKGMMKCSNGLLIQPDVHFTESNKSYDLLLCTGGPELPSIEFSNEFYSWLKLATKRSSRYGSICNGAFMLGRAGLLDGHIATTHWSDAKTLANLCSLARIESDKLYIQDGNLYTSAGVTAGIDLCLYILTKDHSPEISLNVAKRLVVYSQRSGGQSQFSQFLTLQAQSTSPIAIAQQYILNNMHTKITVTGLASLVKMSARHFSRMFMSEVKVTPAEFVERARIDAARAALELNQLPIKTVAYECGFHSATHMRRAFMKTIGVSPKQFRLNFGNSQCTD